jgi:hypothetical protein
MKYSLSLKKDSVSVGEDVLGGETPSSNTGLISQRSGYEIGLDWLDFSLRNVSGSVEAAKLIGQIEILTGDVIDWSPTRACFNGRAWDGSGRGLKGCMVWYSHAKTCEALLERGKDGNLAEFPDLLPPGWCPVDKAAYDAITAKLPSGSRLVHSSRGGVCVAPDGREYTSHGFSIESDPVRVVDCPAVLKVALPARILAGCSMSAIAEFLSSRDDVVASRVDVALDDMDRFVEMADIQASVMRQDYFLANKSTVINSGGRGEPVGATVYLGSPTSDKRLRIYDKTVESKGVRDCIRWELELRRKRADSFLSAWLSSMNDSAESAARLMKSVVVGSIDFRDRSGGEKNRDRAPVVGWWRDMLNRLSVCPLIIRCSVVVASIQKSIDWIVNQVSPSLFSVRKVLGDDWLSFVNSAMDRGGERLAAVRRRLTNETNRESLCY